MTAPITRSCSRMTSLAAVVALLVATLAVGSPAQAHKVRPTFFGMHDSAVSGGEGPGVKTGAIRLWDSGTSWREIETTQGTFDWSRLDQAVAIARAHGLRPMIVMGQTPKFYATRPHAQGSYGPGATSMPRLAAWKRYVGALAHRYGNLVDYQVWNEPNVAGYWTGTQVQMKTLTVTASKKIKHVAGRKATVVGPSFPLRLSTQRKWFAAFWGQKAGRKSLTRYVDVVAANLYPLEQQAPEAQLPLIRFARESLPRHKPLWNTEINFGLRGGPAARRISDTLQASYVARTLVLNAANVGRLFWYAWDVGPIANTHLRASDGELTPAGRAWNVTHDWLVGTTPKGCARRSTRPAKGLYTCTFRAGRRDLRRVYWKPTGHAVRVTTARSTRSWSTVWGQVTPHHGAVHLRVGRSPVMVSSRR